VLVRDTGEHGEAGLDLHQLELQGDEDVGLPLRRHQRAQLRQAVGPGRDRIDEVA
jgi:hypothetical protein